MFANIDNDLISAPCHGYQKVAKTAIPNSDAGY